MSRRSKADKARAFRQRVKLRREEERERRQAKRPVGKWSVLLGAPEVPHTIPLSEFALDVRIEELPVVQL